LEKAKTLTMHNKENSIYSILLSFFIIKNTLNLIPPQIFYNSSKTTDSKLALRNKIS
jgi:hypothetical protein